jgi:hypothetical protein
MLSINSETPIAALTVRQFKELFFPTPQKQDTKPDIPPIFGIDICAKVTGFAKPTIYRNTSKNLIPHFKREGKIFFKREEVYSWMTENRIKTVSEIIQEADEKFIKARKG